MDFVDTEKDFDFLDEFPYGEIKKAVDNGFEKVPDDHAAPDDKYEYLIFGSILYYKLK